MSEQAFSFTIRVEDFDLTRLPISAEALRADPALLNQAISGYYSEIFRKVGGTANVAIAEGSVHVSWFPKEGSAKELLMERALELLKKGNYREAEPLLHSLQVRYPDDATVLLNYGMMLSDERRLEEAIRLLERLVELVPGHSHGWTALGVAHSRNRERNSAFEAFKIALEIDPSNAHAARNAAASVAETSPEEALPLYERALEGLPDDQATLLGYGSCLLELGRTERADEVLRRCVEINPLSDAAEHARTARTKIAHQTMRGAVGGSLRPDVVMYCLGALEKFVAMGTSKTGAITAEIAMLGRRGLNINDPAQKYTLSGLPGKFSGLQLVSIMYAGMKLIAPEQDAGIDLSREYAEAKKMFDAKQSSGVG
jgi:tetratricopeptide (TPR) repeat protein